MPTIYGFIHVCTINHWESILRSQFDLLLTSNLYAITQQIHIGVVGPEKAYFVSPLKKVNQIYHHQNIDTYELDTLKFLHEFCCQHQDSYVWYIHTKGVSQPHNSNEADWRNLMEYFVIERHEDCIAALATHDICGINWESRRGIFGGNFWWAKADYVHTLPINYLNTNDRYRAETFIGIGNPKVLCLHNSHLSGNHYHITYPRDRYANFINATKKHSIKLT